MIKKHLPFLVILFLFWSCNDSADAETGNEILSFKVEGQVSEAIINSEASTVFVELDRASDLTIIKPLIEVSKNASIDPASGIETDFSNGAVKYMVVAENNEINYWMVTIVNPKSDDADILSFYVKRQKEDALIEDTSVTVEVRLGTNLKTIKPQIEISINATISPASEEELDFSNGPIVYTVTSESGRQQKWLVNVMGEKIYPADILTYTVPNQIGESIFDGNKIYVEVPVGNNLTKVEPILTSTDGTTVSPESGEAVDFSVDGYIDYTVTTEINSKENWRVYITEEVIKADNPKIQYMGRVDFANPLKPRLYAAAATINVKFKGTYCQIILNDEQVYGSYNNYLHIIVDGMQEIRIQTTGKANTIDVVKDLSEGEHTLTISKATEAAIGYIEFIGLRCDELLDPDPLPERRIEFIGNSITSGSGIDDSLVACDAGEWYDQHNGYLAYGPQTARLLNAQWMLSSESGIGLIHSCCDKTNTMPDIYPNVNLSVSGNDWDFSKYQADVVSICLGQNDGVQDSVVFCSAYVDFIAAIRSKYPNANIICINSPMADDNLYALQVNYLTGVVNQVNANGDSKVHKHFVKHNLNSGCSWHPNMDQHTAIASELAEYLKDLMNW